MTTTLSDVHAIRKRKRRNCEYLFMENKKKRRNDVGTTRKVLPFSDFAAAVTLRLDDVKTVGKKMAKSVRGGEKEAARKTASVSAKSALRKDPRAQSVPGFKNPNVKALTKDLVIKPPKTAAQLRSPPGRRSRSRKRVSPHTEGIFQEGRQRPSGPVRTFIVFKASGRRRLKRKVRKAPRMFVDHKFRNIPVYDPKFYDRKDRKREKRSPQTSLTESLHVRGTGSEAGRRKPEPKMKIKSKVMRPVVKPKIQPPKVTLKAEKALPAGKKPQVVRLSAAAAKPKTRRRRVRTLQKRPVRKKAVAMQPARLTLSRKGGLKPRFGLDNRLKSRIINVQMYKKFRGDD